MLIFMRKTVTHSERLFRISGSAAHFERRKTRTAEAITSDIG